MKFQNKKESIFGFPFQLINVKQEIKTHRKEVRIALVIQTIMKIIATIQSIVTGCLSERVYFLLKNYLCFAEKPLMFQLLRSYNIIFKLSISLQLISR